MRRVKWVLLLVAAVGVAVAVRRRGRPAPAPRASAASSRHNPRPPRDPQPTADPQPNADPQPTADAEPSQDPPVPATAAPARAPLVVPPSPAASSEGPAPSEEDDVTSTELPDRRRLVKDLAAHLEQRRLVTALRIDLDDFDGYARQHGATRADEVVYAAGAAVRSAVRPADKVYRYGPTSFCALLVSTTLTEAELVGGRVRAAVRALDLGPSGPVTVSVGIAEGVFSAAAVTLDLAESAVTQARLGGPGGMATAT